MIIAFTGTRKGMTLLQKQKFRHLILTARMTAFLNGCAIGADQDALASISLYPKIRLELYPGDQNQFKRAEIWVEEYRWPNYIIHTVQPYLKRNKAMAEACEHLIATPAENVEVRRSGTWATIRYAGAAGKMRTIIFPDGSIEFNP